MNQISVEFAVCTLQPIFGCFSAVHTCMYQILVIHIYMYVYINMCDMLLMPLLVTGYCQMLCTKAMLSVASSVHLSQAAAVLIYTAWQCLQVINQHLREIMQLSHNHAYTGRINANHARSTPYQILQLIGWVLMVLWTQKIISYP